MSALPGQRDGNGIGLALSAQAALLRLVLRETLRRKWNKVEEELGRMLR